MIRAANRRARLVDVIAAEITDGKVPTTRSLAPKLDVSFKTIQTDLRVLRDAGRVTWDTDPSGRIRQGTLRIAHR